MPQNAAERLLANRERILLLWEERLRKEVSAARDVPSSVLIDALPTLLDQLADALSPDSPGEPASSASATSAAHGAERRRLTVFELKDLISEYRLLRQVLTSILEETGPFLADDRAALNTLLDSMIMDACSGFALVQSSLRDQFLATLAHDLRNPLNAARTAAAIIAENPGADDVARWAVRIVDNIGRVDRMICDILDAMRVQTGALLTMEQMKPCDLVAVVRQSLARFEATPRQRIVVLDDGPVLGHVEPDAVARAVENLTSNALKYGEPDQPITAEVREARGRAIITVHNHGPHIPEEKHETLFRAFQQLREGETSGKGGWGLGLAQVRAVAEAHGGDIGVESAPGKGTTFTINIPLDARPFQRQPSATSAATAARGHASLNHGSEANSEE